MSDKIEFDVTDEDPSLLLEDDAEGQAGPASGDAPPAPEPAAENEPSDGIAELRARLEAEQKERQAAQERARYAEERATKSEREATTGRAQGIDGQIQHFASVLAQLSTKGEVLERDLTEAWQAGDYAKAAKLQREIAKNEYHQGQIEQGQAHLEQTKAQQVRQPAPKPADPEKSWEEQNPRSAAWLKANPQRVADDAGRAEVNFAHQLALKAGHAIDSEAYIAFVDKHFAKDEAPAPAARRPGPLAAPVSKPAAAPGAQVRVKLTAFDREMAEASGVSLEEYARSIAATRKA